MDVTVTLLDLIKGWVAENYPQLHVRKFLPPDLAPSQEQVRIYIKPDSDSFYDCLVTLYCNPEVKNIWYVAPDRRLGNLSWEPLSANINLPNYLDLLREALELGIKNFKAAH